MGIPFFYQMKSEILKINKLLVKKFAIPERNKRNPSPLDTLIGTILSQNTNDNNSYKAYMNLKNNFKDWKEVDALSASEIEEYIKVAGLGKQKSKAIKTILENLSKKNPPYSLEYLYQLDNVKVLNELTSYDGVGLKTASCVLLFSMNRNVCPVDTHVHRTLNRIGLVSTSAPDKTAVIINKNLPEGVAHTFHTNLIKLGREYCRPANPDCGGCPLTSICKYPDKNTEIKRIGKKNTFLLLDNL